MIWALLVVAIVGTGFAIGRAAVIFDWDRRNRRPIPEQGRPVSDEWNYTTEPAGEPLFVGAITDAMVERGARALYAKHLETTTFFREFEEMHEAFERDARTVLDAALPSREQRLAKGDE